MTEYQAPIPEISLALKVAGLGEILALPHYEDVQLETVEFSLAEFGRFASEVVAPTDQTGDIEGSVLDPESATVRTPSGFQLAYRRYVESGWGAAQFDTVYGGGGLPSLVGIALQEMMASANLAFSLNQQLTQSAIELLLQWGTAKQRSTYLPRLMTGEWSGTMDLTEPEAGSDLGEVSTRAVPDGNDRWRISGTKIFITWGEHDLAENIVHLVLARTDGAPAGTKGLSLFLVPKFLVDKENRLARRNTLRCLRVEDKLGIHASPTCVMEFDGALGELVGDEHGGIRAMFTMMNAARLSIGIQGPSVGERAFQHARHYARQRRQGRATGALPPKRSVLTEHPDVRRMLLSMRTSTLAGRLLIYSATGYRDKARHQTSAKARTLAQAYLDLLTPVAKAWSTDTGFLSASTGIQILGGAGYVEESGMAQRLRDGRIATIYEGTNGIQAIDLVMRKLPRDGGTWIRRLIEDVAIAATGREHSRDLQESYKCLASAIAVLTATTEWMLSRVTRSPDDALAGATSYLELLGLTLGGSLMIQRAECARTMGTQTKIGATTAAAESEFFATEYLARTSGLVRPIMSGARRLAALE